MVADLNRRSDLGHVPSQPVVLTGDSAGGIGVWTNVDWLQTMLPQARVIGAPLAGFYAFAYPYTGPRFVERGEDFRKAAWASHVDLWHSYLPVGAATNGAE